MNNIYNKELTNDLLKRIYSYFEKDSFNYKDYILADIVDDTENNNSTEPTSWELHFMKNSDKRENSGEFWVQVDSIKKTIIPLYYKDSKVIYCKHVMSAVQLL